MDAGRDIGSLLLSEPAALIFLEPIGSHATGTMKRIDLAPGDRVRLSALGKRNSRRPDRSGVVTGVMRTSTMYRVKWDGLRSEQSIHMVFLERDGRVADATQTEQRNEPSVLARDGAADDIR